ncbi:MAG TPA: hypothetical protein VGM03_11305 [Phycisphaerae bacterium]|jgi:hypothetical protein
MGRDISLLDRIHIAAPCSASWADMQGDERVRFCDACKLNVYNLSAMTRHDAEALILEREGRLCARFYRRADGTILTENCPVGLRALRRRLARTIGRFAAVFAMLMTTIAALGGGRGGARILRLRQWQPFAAVCDWLDPPPTPVMPAFGSVIVLGSPDFFPTNSGRSPSFDLEKLVNKLSEPVSPAPDGDEHVSSQDSVPRDRRNP